MSRQCAGALLRAVFVLALAGSARAQPVVYVSNFSGHQILTVDGTSGVTKVLFSGAQIGSPNFSPEDMVVGPDGDLYICDSLNRQVWRFDPASPLGAGNPQIVVRTTDLPAGTYPEGPTFSGSDDLYFNTRGSGSNASGGSGANGVWVVQNVAVFGSSPPYSVRQAISSAGSGGEGTVVDMLGNLLIVDSADNQVLSSSPHQTGSAFDFGPSAPPLPFTGLSAPVGIATDTCGDVLVASGTGIQQLRKDPNTGGFIQNTYVDFGRGNIVSYFERDSSNNLYVATNTANGSTPDGMVWRVAPVGADPIASCASGTATLLVDLKRLAQGSNATLSNTQTQAIGVAIPPTSVSVTRLFTPQNPTQTFNFGHYQFFVSYAKVLDKKGFNQTFTAIVSRPQDVSFSTPPFTGANVGIRFPSLGGFVVQFLTASQASGGPVAGVDFQASTSTTPAITITLAFHDPIHGFNHPGLAHSSNDSAAGPVTYTEDITHDFWVLLDQALGGTRPIWHSEFVPFDEPIVSGFALPLKVQLNEPALSNNPLFNLGQNFTVAITVTDQNGTPVPGLTLRVSAARLNPTPIALQLVQATNNSTEQNVMNDNGKGKYSIGIDTSLFTGGPGTYQFSISGDGFPPELPATPLPFLAVFQK